MTDYPHPLLFAGFNADPINGDEADGSGTNWQIWPVLFDSFIGLQPLIITEEMLEAFEGCADLCVPAADNRVAFVFEDMLAVVGDSWPDLVVGPEASTIRFPQQARTQKMRDHRGMVSVAGGRGSMALPREARVRKVG